MCCPKSIKNEFPVKKQFSQIVVFCSIRCDNRRKMFASDNKVDIELSKWHTDAIAVIV